MWKGVKSKGVLGKWKLKKMPISRCKSGRILWPYEYTTKKEGTLGVFLFQTRDFPSVGKTLRMAEYKKSVGLS